MHNIRAWVILFIPAPERHGWNYSVMSVQGSHVHTHIHAPWRNWFACWFWLWLDNWQYSGGRTLWKRTNLSTKDNLISVPCLYTHQKCCKESWDIQDEEKPFLSTPAPSEGSDKNLDMDFHVPTLLWFIETLIIFSTTFIIATFINDVNLIGKS